MIVSGPPGAGKTTIARQLAPMVHLPLIAKDDIKESLADSLGKRSLRWSKRLGAATWDLLFVEMERFGEAGASAMFESNFYPRQHAARIGELVARHAMHSLEVHVIATPETMVERHRNRERHAIHHSPILTAGLARRWAENNGPLRIGPMVEVDTTEPESVDLRSIVEQIREATRGTEH